MVLAFLQGKLPLNLLNSYKAFFFFLADCFIFIKRCNFMHVFVCAYKLTFRNGHVLCILKFLLLLKSNSNSIKTSTFYNILYNACANF